MGADTLVFKRKGGKNIVKIIPSMRGGRHPENCHIKVNMENFKDLALFFHDLEDIWNVPVSKAIAEFKKDKEGGWPF